MKAYLFNLFFRKKLLLGFEHGVILTQVAQQHGIELTPEIMERAEKVLAEHFSKNSSKDIACTMEVVILSIFEPDTRVDETNKEAEASS